MIESPTSTIELTENEAAPASGVGRGDLPNWLLVAVFLPLYAVAIGWGLPSIINPAVDSPAPFSVLAFAGAYANPNVANTYPAAHQLLLLAIYGVLFAVFKLAGWLGHFSSTWPYGMQHPVTMISTLIVASRLVSMAMALAVLACLKRMLAAGGDRRGQWAGVALLGLSGIYVYYAREANVDLPALCWSALGLASLWRHLFEGPAPRRYLLISAACFAVAAATKDPVAGLAPGAALALLFGGEKVHSNWRGRVKQAAIFSALLCAVYLLVAVLPQPWRWASHVRLYSLSSDRMLQYVEFENSLSGQLRLFGAAASCLLRILTPAGVLLAIGGAAALVKRGHWQRLAFLLLPALTYYFLFIFNIRFVYDRFMLPVAFLMAALAGIGATAAFNYAASGRRQLRFAAGCVGALILAYQFGAGYLPVTYLQVSDLKRTLARSIATAVPPGTSILWLGRRVDAPNAEVAGRYNLVLPPGVEPSSRYVGEVLKPYDPQTVYLLSGRALDLAPQQGRLLRVWGYPAWVTSFVQVPSLKEYYLYQLHAPAPPALPKWYSLNDV